MKFHGRFDGFDVLRATDFRGENVPLWNGIRMGEAVLRAINFSIVPIPFLAVRCSDDLEQRTHCIPTKTCVSALQSVI